jgi:hypothetical protein
VDKVLGDNFIYIFELHKPVPDSLGINHHNRAMLALVEAARLVGTNNMFQASIFNCILESRFDLLASPRKAAWPGRSFVSLIGANEDVVLKFRHWQIFPSLHLCSDGCTPRAAF